MIYIVIPVFNRWIYTDFCLKSLINQTFTEYKIVIVDHGSTDGTSENIKKKYPNVIVLKGNDSMWWTGATNVGVQFALKNNAKFVLTLNNDLVVDSNYLETLNSFSIQNPNSIIGSISCDINNKEKVIFSGISWNKYTAKYSNLYDLSQNYSDFMQKNEYIESALLPGRGTLFPVQVFIHVGLFDENKFPHYMADEDLSAKANNAGYKLLINPKSVVYIHTNATGLKTVHQTKTFKFWIDTFTSIKSPNNFKVRWQWAQCHGSISSIYFLLDILRIFFSTIKKNVRR